MDVCLVRGVGVDGCPFRGEGSVDAYLVRSGVDACLARGGGMWMCAWSGSVDTPSDHTPLTTPYCVQTDASAR